jgi:hypothetical protein
MQNPRASLQTPSRLLGNVIQLHRKRPSFILRDDRFIPNARASSSGTIASSKTPELHPPRPSLHPKRRSFILRDDRFIENARASSRMSPSFIGNAARLRRKSRRFIGIDGRFEQRRAAASRSRFASSQVTIASSGGTPFHRAARRFILRADRFI